VCRVVCVVCVVCVHALSRGTYAGSLDVVRFLIEELGAYPFASEGGDEVANHRRMYRYRQFQKRRLGHTPWERALMVPIPHCASMNECTSSLHTHTHTRSLSHTLTHTQHTHIK
jgi:hypothetical protein